MKAAGGISSIEDAEKFIELRTVLEQVSCENRGQSVEKGCILTSKTR